MENISLLAKLGQEIHFLLVFSVIGHIFFYLLLLGPNIRYMSPQVIESLQ